MCGEWMVYGDDYDDNNGESLILLFLFWGDTFLNFWGEWDALYFLSSHVGILYP